MLNSFRGFKEFEIGGAVRPFHIGTNQTRIWCEAKAARLYKRARTEEAREKYSDPLEPSDYTDTFLFMDTDPKKNEKFKKAFSGENWQLLVYSCLVAGHELQRMVVDFEPVHVAAWLDEPEWSAGLSAEFVSFFYVTHTERISKLNELLRQMQNPAAA